MAEKKPAKATAKQTATRTSSKASTKASDGFTAEERAAMQERARELKASARRGSSASKAAGESDLLAKIAEMTEPDRAMAERIHAIVMASAPDLAPRTGSGMPAYGQDGDVICFFQGAQTFKSPYSTFGFSDKAKLDEGGMWPSSFALVELNSDVEARIAALVKQAVS